MYNLLQVYICPSCGEILSDEVGYTEDIDTENDEVYPLYLCELCLREVRPKLVGGQPCYREVGDERAAWAAGAYDEADEEDDEEDWEDDEEF